MDVRTGRASAVVVHRIPEGAADWFADWQRGISAAAGRHPGYGGTDVYPPGPENPGEWVTVLHFEDETALRLWLASAERAAWLKEYRSHVGEFEVTPLAGGFGPWFAGQSRRSAPPRWKMALAVLLGLYPTVMILTLAVGPLTRPLGMALSVLVSNALGVAALQWVVMPAVSVGLGPWLRARGRKAWAFSAGGVVAIILVLAVLAGAFRWLSG